MKTITAPADQPLRLWIEPWAYEREFPPGTVVTLRARSPQDGHLEIVPAEDATWVYGWVGSTLELLVSGEQVALFDNPPPALPEGMSMRDFIGGVLGARPRTERTRRTLKLMTDYNCPPLWESGGDVGPVELDTLPLSPALRKALQAWADTYDGILNRDDPASSGWARQEDRHSFEREGLRLWGALQAELGPAVRIVYHSEMDHRVHEPEEIERGLTEGFADAEAAATRRTPSKRPWWRFWGFR
jgi:hypothetical protein